MICSDGVARELWFELATLTQQLNRKSTDSEVEALRFILYFVTNFATKYLC